MKHTNTCFLPTTNNIIDSLESDIYTILNCINYSLDTWQAWSDDHFSGIQQTILGTLELLSLSLGIVAAMLIYTAKWSAIVLYCCNIKPVSDFYQGIIEIQKGMITHIQEIKTQLMTTQTYTDEQIQTHKTLLQAIQATELPISLKQMRSHLI